MKLFCTIIVLFLSKTVTGQIGAEFVGLGSNRANSGAQFCSANNPSYIPADKIAVGTFLQNRFTGTSIISGALAGTAKFKNTAFGVKLRYNGTEYLSNNLVDFAVGQKISNTLSAGFGIGWNKIFQTAGYGYTLILKAHVGAMAKITDKLDAAFVLSNPWYSKNSIGNNQAEVHLASGYKINGQTKIWAQYNSGLNTPAVYGLAVRHQLPKSVAFMCALQTGYEPVSAGVSMAINQMRLEMATAYHVYLGFSPAFSLLWKMQ